MSFNFFYLIVQIYFSLPWMFLPGAQTSNIFVPFSFNTQWYSNIFGCMHDWFIEEQFLIFFLISHSWRFLGQLLTVFTVLSDGLHDIALAPSIHKYVCKENDLVCTLPQLVSNHIYIYSIKIKIAKRNSFASKNNDSLSQINDIC